MLVCVRAFTCVLKSIQFSWLQICRTCKKCSRLVVLFRLAQEACTCSQYTDCTIGVSTAFSTLRILASSMLCACVQHPVTVANCYLLGLGDSSCMFRNVLLSVVLSVNEVSSTISALILIRNLIILDLSHRIFN